MPTRPLVLAALLALAALSRPASAAFRPAVGPGAAYEVRHPHDASAMTYRGHKVSVGVLVCVVCCLVSPVAEPFLRRPSVVFLVVINIDRVCY